MPANQQGHLRIMHQRKGRGWNWGFVVKACLSISLKWNLYHFKGGSSIFIEVFMLSWKGVKLFFKKEIIIAFATKCIVCVQGHGTFNLSFLSFFFLTGWEFYGPNCLKC